MRIFTFFLSLVFFTHIIAQTSIQIPFGGNFNLPAHTAKDIQFDGGFIYGDFSKMDSQDYVALSNYKLTVKDSDKPVCYSTHNVKVNNHSRIKFQMDVSGTGTLDNGDRKDWHDWVDINYVIDGESYLVGEDKHTISGQPQNIEQEWIALDNNQEFSIEVCMLMTGDDESYSISNILIDLEEKSPIQEIEEIKEPTIFHTPIENNRNNLGISVFPNPSIDWLHIENDFQYNVNNIELYNLGGQSLGKVTYPVNVQHLVAGTYFLKVQRLNSDKFNTAKFVVKRP